MTQKNAPRDAHSREKETCRKRPHSARECAKAHSLWSCHRKLLGNNLNTGKMCIRDRDRIRVKEAGMDEHIAKPVDVKLLVKVIHRLSRTTI